MVMVREHIRGIEFSSQKYSFLLEKLHDYNKLIFYKILYLFLYI